jgi:hypothetical protein
MKDEINNDESSFYLRRTVTHNSSKHVIQKLISGERLLRALYRIWDREPQYMSTAWPKKDVAFLLRFRICNHDGPQTDNFTN